MEIQKMNVDFGNSMFMTFIDNYYLEIPTNIVELQQQEVEGYFVTAAIEPKEFINRILISTKIDGEGEERYFLVGKISENHLLSNKHITKLHDKTKSYIPYVTFLASVAYYHGLNNQNKLVADNEVVIKYFSTMLPIWLLKGTSKFSEMQSIMAKRFLGVHEVTVRTLGFEKTLLIEVEESKCRIEGEVARWAIKKDFDLTDLEEANQFNDNEVVIVDIGARTIDLVMLPAGLQAPKDRDAMQSITDLPYLVHLEKLRIEKLIEEFDNVGTIEKFIFNNVHRSKMELIDGISLKTIDLTQSIKSSLRDYARLLISKVQDAFAAPKDQDYKYIYIGGVAPILRNSIKEEIEERYSPEIFEANHIFLPKARRLNLDGLEILSRNDIFKKQNKNT